MWCSKLYSAVPRIIISALLVLLIPNTTANHAITYTNAIPFYKLRTLLTNIVNDKYLLKSVAADTQQHYNLHGNHHMTHLLLMFCR